MAEYEQMEMDIRLDSERDLKDNLVKVIQFTYNNQEREREESGSLAPVRNKNEGYGIAAATYTRIVKCEKDLKGGMNDYLTKLQVEGDEAIKECSRLYDATLNVAMNAIIMAADMTRILNDLYYGSDSPKTPLEDAFDDEEDDSEDDFEEAGATDAEASEMQDEEVGTENENSEREARESAEEDEE